MAEKVQSGWYYETDSGASRPYIGIHFQGAKVPAWKNFKNDKIDNFTVRK